MAALVLTAVQKSTIIDPVEPFLEAAFAAGVEAPALTPYLEAMQLYEQMRPEAKQGTKNVMRLIFSALIKAMGFDRVGLGTGAAPTVVTLAKLTPGGSNGSLTIIGGLITAVSAPT